MAAAAVRLAAQLFEDLHSLNILFIGAGEMVELAATHFAARKPRRLVIANRTPERATQLAQRFGGETLPMAEIGARLHEFDAVMSCTASPQPLVLCAHVEHAIKARKRRPMFMVDLAVPRDIDPKVRDLPDVYLYTVDDLSQMVQVAGAKRQGALAQAEAIVETGVQGFEHWQSNRLSVPFIHELQQQVDAWRDTTLARARKQLQKGEPPETVLEAFAHQFTHKMLHGVWVELHASEGQAREQLEAQLSKLLLRR
jgi:glutamyl-tRNA reductase